jgi:NADP-dependent 3-hydroxy acid dehydrogenase YdfG
MALRKQVNPRNIKVTLIEPGAVGTDMQSQYSPEEQREKIECCGQKILLPVSYIR